RGTHLVGGVFVEDGGALEEVLSDGHEVVDVGSRVDASVGVRALSGLERELLVGDAGGDRREAGVTDPNHGDTFRYRHGPSLVETRRSRTPPRPRAESINAVRAAATRRRPAGRRHLRPNGQF